MFEMCGPAWPEVTSGAAVATAAHKIRLHAANDEGFIAAEETRSRPKVLS